jgi:hypothetical protein
MLIHTTIKGSILATIGTIAKGGGIKIKTTKPFAAAPFFPRG